MYILRCMKHNQTRIGGKLGILFKRDLKCFRSPEKILQYLSEHASSCYGNRTMSDYLPPLTAVLSLQFESWNPHCKLTLFFFFELFAVLFWRPISPTSCLLFHPVISPADEWTARSIIEKYGLSYMSELLIYWLLIFNKPWPTSTLVTL